MTARMLAAMDNPYLTIIGHPTGRLLLSRDPYGLDLDAVIEKAAANGVALEINADPHRLDLDWRVLRRARDGGAHDLDRRRRAQPPGIGNVEYGVGDGAEGLARPGRHPQRPLRRGLPRVRQAPALKTRKAHAARPAGRESKAAKAARAETILQPPQARRYPDAQCALDHRNAFELLCATILSAQCTDARVNMVTPAFFARYPHAEALAARRTEGRRGDHPVHRLLPQQDEEPDRHGAGPGRGARRRGAAHDGAARGSCRGSGARPPTSCSATRSASTRASRWTPTSPGCRDCSGSPGTTTR